MREWNLKSGDPLSLILASDARSGPTDYVDDQIWELAIGAGDPPAVSLNTTYGLRTKAARVFLRFTEGDQARNDPLEFTRQPLVHQVFPNFIGMSFSPFQDIDVTSEVWVPQSHAISGRVSISNQGRVERKILAEVVGQLSPNLGQRMAPFEMAASTLLCGLSGGIAPVLFMTGGAKSGPGPYPSLALTMQLAPGEERQFNWVQAALGDRESSFALARSIVNQNWESIKSHLEMLNASQVEIYSGEPDWDAAFMLSQKHAAGLFVGPTPHLPQPSFVVTRQPDQGYSLQGDGSDYNHLWNGQTALEACFLAETLLPSMPEAARGLVRNFLSVQDESGAIDWKPGLGGQRNRLLATPLLSHIIWRIYEHTEDREFLQECFSGLCRFVQSWLAPSHDRDRDGIPEWDSPLQCGLEYHPVYSRWQMTSLGVDITSAESPSLSAMLWREIECLKRIADLIDRRAEVQPLEAIGEKLKEAVEDCWDEPSACYLDRDRDTHYSTRGELLLEGRGAGIFLIQRDFEEPVRLMIRIRTDETVRRHPLIFVHGKGAAGHSRIEKIGDDQYRWMPGSGQMTGKYVYSRLERVEIYGLEPEDTFTIHSVDFHNLDLTLLAPLWAGIPDRERADRLVEETLTYPTLFWREYGLPACPQPTSESDQNACWSLNMLWNSLIGSGLVRYGYRSQAAELISRLMAAVVYSLKRDRAFRRSYHAETAQGQAEFHALTGLAPLGLFLEVLGVRLISSKRVGLSGFNPFPWPVTVKYRGMTIMRQKDKTVVIFPDNQTVTVSDPEPRLVSLELQDEPAKEV